MSKNLLIVESPNKIKKIKTFLGSDWDVKASVGHISDLAIGLGLDGLGFEDANSFKPLWRVSKDKKSVVTSLKKAVAAANKVYLATDPDREGEAIANQLIFTLKLKNYERVSFNEISKEAIERAIADPVGLDKLLVEAQETRRIIDRAYGFKGSRTIRNFNQNLISVGRVQSVGLRIIVARELSIRSFKPRKYQRPFIDIDGTEFELKMELEEIINKDWSSFEVPNEMKVEVLKKQLKNVPPPKPLSTSSALKLGASLNLKTKEASKILQSLFEQGLLTYIRTDSTNLSKDFKKEAKEYIESSFTYKTDITRTYKLAAGAQEGHEAIRPVHIEDDGSKITNHKEKEFYQAVRRITIASLLESGLNVVQKMQVVVDGLTFENRITSIYKQGFREHIPSKAKDVVPGVPLDSETIYKTKLVLKDKSTVAPKRYSESTFLSKIEKEGIGRPSTYSSMLSTIQERQYVVAKDKKLSPTPEGIAVIKFLSKFYPQFVQISFTGEMEQKLDLISLGKLDRVTVLQEFWKDLIIYFNNAEAATEKLYKAKNGTCPKCDSYLKVIHGKFSSFYGCSNYPNCVYKKKSQ